MIPNAEDSIDRNAFMAFVLVLKSFNRLSKLIAPNMKHIADQLSLFQLELVFLCCFITINQ